MQRKRRKVYFPENSGRGSLERTLVKDGTENPEGREGRKVQDLELSMAVNGAVVGGRRTGPWARRGRSGTGRRRKERSTERRSWGLG